MLNTEFWKKYFEVYDFLNILEPYQNTLNLIVKNLDIVSGDKILDAGSGTGNLSLLLEEKGAIVTALDSSLEGLSIHKNKKSEATLIKHSLIDVLPFPDNFFDKVCSNNTIYTLPKSSHDLVFKEFYRVLRPGGLLVVSNIRKGFSPWVIYSNHIKSSLGEKGFLKTLFQIFILLIPTLKIFYYNGLIKRENIFGGYNFFSEGEQSLALKNAGFVDVFPEVFTYAGQAILIRGKK